MSSRSADGAMRAASLAIAGRCGRTHAANSAASGSAAGIPRWSAVTFTL
jgi:hypothetical protein